MLWKKNLHLESLEKNEARKGGVTFMEINKKG